MEINRHNYEAYLLDLLEGRLSVENQQALQDFLRLNPDCNAELSVVEPWLLEPDRIHFPDRGRLKREFPGATSILTRDNFDLFSIARMEGDLTPEQEEAHRRTVSENVQNSRQWSEWQNSKLVAEHIVFNDKKSLYRRRGLSRRFILMSVVSVAATLALLVILLRMDPVSSTKELSVQSSPDTRVKELPAVTGDPEIQPGLAEPLQEQTIQETPALPMQKHGNPAMFSVVRDHAGPPEAASKEVMIPKDDLKPRPVKMQDVPVFSSLAGNPVPDQIEPLEIPSVSIHLRSLSVAQISGMDLQEIVKEYKEEKDFSLWTVAKAGIKGINRIAGSEISLMASRDEEGEVSGFQLKSKRFSVTRPLGQEE